jgi:hypothetical protein
VGQDEKVGPETEIRNAPYTHYPNVPKKKEEIERIKILADWIRQPKTGQRRTQAVHQYFRLVTLVSCLSMHSL